MYKTFTKSMLRTGMHVLYTSGDERIVILGWPDDGRFDTLIDKGGDICLNLDTSREDLSGKWCSKNIIKVWAADSTNLFMRGELLWEKQTPKNLTQSQIEAILGYPIRII